jgi:cathepsin X
MDSGDEYWIGKGLWGTYWGEDGYFRINMRKDNLGIDKNCMWGDPDMK